MQFRNYLMAGALGLLLLPLVSCQGMYTKPDGSTVAWEYDPSTGDKKATYGTLEEAYADNLTAQVEGTISGNFALVALAESNMEDIAQAKKDLGYNPPRKTASHSMVSAVQQA